jgi:hypothetical protein
MAYAARQYDCPFVISWRRAGITEVKTAWNKARQRAKVRAYSFTICAGLPSVT